LDNGNYKFKRSNSEDYGYNMKRNLTIIGLESGMAKGYNFVEEVDNISEGINAIYFDSETVSPDYTKK
jgi:hypothetical protein